MSHQLTFEKLLNYDVGEDGIFLDVEIRYVDVTVKLRAKIDTGSTYSIFERKFGEQLGLDIEKGMRQRFGTATGGFYGYGFRVSLFTADLEFDSMVFFAENEYFGRNVLGRIGWLDQIILGVVDVQGKVYLSPVFDE